MRLTIKTPPAAMPLDLQEAKRHCLVEDGDTEDDTLIEGFIAAAVDYLDGPTGILGRAIITQSWLLELETWPTRLSLPLEPVRSVSISYLDRDGVEHVLPSDDWHLDQYPSRRSVLNMQSGSRPALQAVRYPVRIMIEAGFGSPNDVPKSLIVAIQMLVADWYERRGEIMPSGPRTQLPAPVSMLISRWRVIL
ncbi:hypothetical protein VXL47_12195 [Phaeobacter sp. JH20_30]|uniref:head-tail connector protein n=1 Tax=unclassified Phaeobacter TaxID=2621772 RepID=UPI003A843B6F